MVEMLIFGSHPQEVKALELYSKEYAALFTEEKWNYFSCRELKLLTNFVRNNPLLDMACIDITVEGAIEQVAKLRNNNKHAYITIVANASISPAKYMRPQIMAGSLLLKPITKEQLLTSYKEAFETFSKRFEQKDVKEQFVIDTKTDKYFIEYNQILYFEAREKKIFLITQAKEIAFYDTIGELEQRLSDRFVRCHRSFIVNKDKIEQIILGSNILILDNGDELPISRSYHKAFKEIRNE